MEAEALVRDQGDSRGRRLARLPLYGRRVSDPDRIRRAGMLPVWLVCDGMVDLLDQMEAVCGGIGGEHTQAARAVPRHLPRVACL